MNRDPSLDETFRELERRIEDALQQIQKLQREKVQLEQRVESLERERAQAAERINIILDRIETLG